MILINHVQQLLGLLVNKRNRNGSGSDLSFIVRLAWNTSSPSSAA